MPLLEQHITAAEWDALVQKGAADADPAELPLAVRHVDVRGRPRDHRARPGRDARRRPAGHRGMAAQTFAEHSRAIHGTPTPPRSTELMGADMPDYGHELMFGAMLEPERAVDAVALAVLAEQAGLDAVSLADHPYWPERLDTFTLLADIAARTDRVRVFPNLANLPLRPPAMLARTAATLDVLSGGRFELGIGSGAQQMWDAIVAEGGPLRGAGESIDALDEAVQVIRALWTTGPEVSFTASTIESPARSRDPHRHMTSTSGWVPTSRGCWGWSDASPTAGYPVRPSCRPNSFPPPTRSSTRPRSTPAGLRTRCVASTTSAASSAEPAGVSAGPACAVDRAAHRAHAGPRRQRVHPLPGRIRRRHKAIRRRGGPGGTQRGKQRARPTRHDRTRRSRGG